jgi:hypothetical protein
MMTTISVALPDDDAEKRRLWAAYEQAIDERLNEARPARSGPKDRNWMEEAGVLGWARNHLPYEQYAVRNFAEAIVIKREALANRRANRLVRRYALGQAPLFWGDLGPLPFTIDEERLRVRFDAATPSDFDNHAAHIRESATSRLEAELLVAAALEDLARQARAAGFVRVALIGDMPQRSQEAA